MTTAYPGAQSLLQEIKERDIPMATVSNNGVAAARTALVDNELGRYIPGILIIGDKTPGAA